MDHYLDAKSYFMNYVDLLENFKFKFKISTTAKNV